MQSPPYSTIPRPRPKGLSTICVEYQEGDTKSVRLCETFRSNYLLLDLLKNAVIVCQNNDVY